MKRIICTLLIIVICQPLFAQKQKTKLVFNYKKLPITIISFALSYDYFKQYDDLRDTIRENEKRFGPDYSDNNKLKSNADRKKFMFAVFAIPGLANTIMSFENIKVTSSNNRITLQYNFN